MVLIGFRRTRYTASEDDDSYSVSVTIKDGLVSEFLALNMYYKRVEIEESGDRRNYGM